jgi:hypothetical protein
VKRALAVVVAALLTVTLTPGTAHSVSYSITPGDAKGDVKILHSRFPGNKDIDIRKVHYQYYASRGRFDLTIELHLRAARPGLKTAQLYTTELIRSGTRYRVYGNDAGGGSLYQLVDGVWEPRTYCDVDTYLNSSGTLSGGNVRIVAEECWPDKRVKILYTRTENYYSSSMTDLAAWDRLTVRKRIGKP